MSRTEEAAFDTHILDAAIARRRERREQERQRLLADLLRLLDELGPRHGVGEAYVFGSITRPGGFDEQSDVDVGVEQVAPARFFDFMGALSLALERDVDMVDLAQCHFAHRIRAKGIRWTEKR